MLESGDIAVVVDSPPLVELTFEAAEAEWDRVGERRGEIKGSSVDDC